MESFYKGHHNVVYFKEDPELTDIVFIVEDKKIHLTKSILIRASPVFRAMFTSDFKEKNESTVKFPGKKYEDFVLFLRCFYPGEHIKLNDRGLEQVLPLAREYGMDSLLTSGQKWMLEEVKTRMKDVSFIMKCFYLAAEYEFKELYSKMLYRLEDINVSMYANDKYFSMLSPRNKVELLEKCCLIVEKENKVIEEKHEELVRQVTSSQGPYEKEQKRIEDLERTYKMVTCKFCGFRVDKVLQAHGSSKPF
ncbi:uncharacterized protein LOC134257646 [Saccostrea cucullata]|uniref:uncharacterized protein LOC134257646 n=1 Tax=Saccostrea cuccullata TaxID=36930 RepID=UPI002ED45AFE